MTSSQSNLEQSITEVIKERGHLAYLKEKGHPKPAIVISKQAWGDGEKMWRLGKSLQIEMGAYLLGRRKEQLIFVDEYILPASDKILSFEMPSWERWKVF